MMRHRLVWVAVAACVVLAIYLSAWLWLAKPGDVRLGNRRNIRGGMTLAEVERLLGGPPGDYSSTPGQSFSSFGFNGGGHSETWVSDEGVVTVHFDRDGLVGMWSYSGSNLVKPSRLERLRARIGW